MTYAVGWYTYPRGVERASEYHYHERGQWKSESYWAESQEERDDKAVHFLRHRNSGTVQCIIRCRFEGQGWEPNRCDEALLWERVEFLNVRTTTRKEVPWPAIAP